MKEQEYVITTNRAFVSSALASLREVLPGDDYGIPKDKFLSITKALSELQSELFKLIITDEEE